MLTLHYAPDNASLVLRIALEEAGLDYQTILVDRAAKAQKSAAYLALNPAGLIPTLQTSHGPIAETAACLLWLVDTYPGAGLGPAADSANRGAFLRWLFFLSNTIHPDLIRMFYPRRFVPVEGLKAHHETMAGHLQRNLDILDAALRDQPELFRPPSALSLYLGPLIRWAGLYPVAQRRWLDLGAYPSIEKLMITLESRPSVVASAQAEGLGPTPFSNPGLPTPPEGSAT